jgi:hypothetical protein
MRWKIANAVGSVGAASAGVTGGGTGLTLLELAGGLLLVADVCAPTGSIQSGPQDSAISAITRVFGPHRCTACSYSESRICVIPHCAGGVRIKSQDSTIRRGKGGQ